MKSKNQFNNSQFASLIQYYCNLWEMESAKEFSHKHWYQVLSEGVLQLANFEKKITTSEEVKHVNYLSLEFLIGRLTGNNLLNLGWYNDIESHLKQYDIKLVDILECERDPSLGNGGLGRLAACYLDSMASIHQPAMGYGLNYQYGLFKQSFIKGEQTEEGDAWGRDNYPWKFLNHAKTKVIGFSGKVTHLQGDKYLWEPSETLLGKAYDLPIFGFENSVIQTLRLWQAENEKGFNLAHFNDGSFLKAESRVDKAAKLTKVLYPNDNHRKGTVLRLMQQYFHCACSVADIVERHLSKKRKLEELPDYEVIQLNDTHPAIAIIELLRLLLDDYDFSWDDAWKITQKTFAYTNHTILPEALETWDQNLIRSLLPRHFYILDKINAIFHQTVIDEFGHDPKIWEKLAILFDNRVRMANLSVVASFAVNGVAKIHSDLLKTDLFPEFHQLYPNKLRNVTNGITPRRWIRQANPRLSMLIDQSIGNHWTSHLDELSQLEVYANDHGFKEDYAKIKLANKLDLAQEIKRSLNMDVDANSIFDVQIKRFHEYKRQHLNLLNIIHCYQQLKDNPNIDFTPRVFIFAGKAAPGYYLAKNIIYAINVLADLINNDPVVKERLKVVFLPDYRVSLAELIIPAADISEQISMAGKEASGTGNMKLALNGALTLGTLDGANVEIDEMVGRENIFIFGHTVDSLRKLQQDGYQPIEYYENNLKLKRAIDFLQSQSMCGDDPNRFSFLVNSLLERDPFFVLADFDSYVAAQQEVGTAYLDQDRWVKSTILNTARLGMFSSDRSIRDYQKRIWHR